MTIMRDDVRAVLIEDEDGGVYHLDCVPEEKWSDLKEENFLFKEDWHDDTFDFCSKCGKIL